MYFRVASQMTEVIWTPQYIDMHLHVGIYDILNVTYLIDFLFVAQFHCKISQHKTQSHIKIGISFHAHRSAVQLRWLHFRLYICGSAKGSSAPCVFILEPRQNHQQWPNLPNICYCTISLFNFAAKVFERSVNNRVGKSWKYKEHC